MRTKWIARGLALVAALVGGTLALAPVVYGATPRTGSQHVQLNQTAPVPGAGTFSGTVTQNGPTLILHASDGDHQVTVAPGSPVLRDGKTTTVDKLKKGDKVTATLNAQGVATRLDARSGGTSAGDVLKWLIPLLILLAVAAFVVWWLMSRNRRGSGVHFGRLHRA